MKSAGDLTEYNAGVIFFNHTAKKVFETWKRIAQTLDSSMCFITDKGISSMPCNDQASLAAAMDELQFNPYVLPMNFNLRPQWHKMFWGEVKIWHSYNPVPDSVVEWNAHQSVPGTVIQCASM